MLLRDLLEYNTKMDATDIKTFSTIWLHNANAHDEKIICLVDRNTTVL